MNFQIVHFADFEHFKIDSYFSQFGQTTIFVALGKSQLFY